MTQRTEHRTSPAGTTARMGGILAVLLSGQFMANVDTAIVNVATPSIQETIGASGAQLELVVSGYVLAYAVLLMTGARLGDLFGYRRLFIIGLAVFTLASLACGLALNPGMLVAARVIQGIGAALMVPQVLIGIHQSLPSSRRPRALGYYALTLAGSGVAGQVLGGALVTANLFGTAWRPIFLINLPVGLILIIVAARVLPSDERHRRRTLDLTGTATLSAALLLVVVPLVLGRELSWPMWTWLCFAACIPTFIVFVLVERRLDRHGKNPLLNLSVVTRPTVGWGLIANVAAGSGYFALLFVLAQYLQQALGKSPLFSGLALVPALPRLESPRLHSRAFSRK